jgi:RNA polymerase sigma factor FliA
MTATAHFADPRNEQIRLMQPLVRRVARHLRAQLPPSVDVDDLIQAGLIGLNEAIGRCDPAEAEAGGLEKFAMPRIRGAMIDELRFTEWASRGCRQSRREIDEAGQRLQQRLCRRPYDSEMAAELCLSLDEYHALQAKLHRSQLMSLDDLGLAGDEDDDGLHGREFGDTTSDPLSVLEQQRMRLALVDAIQGLPEREQQVMLKHYGEDKMFKDIGRELGVSESRVSQMHRHAVEMLRAQLQSH